MNSTQVEAYITQGFTVLRGVLGSEETTRLRQECRRLWEAVKDDVAGSRLQFRDRVNGGRAADRIDPILDISPVMQDLVRDRRIVNLVEQVLGGRAEIFKDKLISKWPGMNGYKTHQDYAYWSFVGDVPPDHLVSALLPLDQFNSTSGAVEFFPRLHGRLLDPSPEHPLDVDETKIDLTTGLILDLEPGDVALFHSLTPHRSSVNLSEHNREALYFTFVRSGHGDLYERYYSDRAPDWLDPKNAGRVASRNQ